MAESVQIEMSLTIRKGGGVDLRTHPEIGFCPRTRNVLRALELGGAPRVAADYIAAARDEASSTEPHPHEAAVVWDITNILANSVQPHCDDAQEIIDHLRAQGLMRTPEDVRLAERLANAETTADDWSRRCKGAMELYETTKDHLDKAQAQVRALTAKCVEANKALDEARARITALERQESERLKAHEATRG